MKKLGFAGAFDPLTNGHLWVIKEAAAISNQVFVYIAQNVNKSGLFNSLEKKKIIEQVLIDNNLDKKVLVQIVVGEYVAKYAKDNGVEYLLRGIRNTMDFDYENLLQQTNTDVLEGAKTLFLMPPRDLGAVSSSYVKNLVGPVGWHWQIHKFLPVAAYNALIIKHLTNYFNEIMDITNEGLILDIINKYSTKDRQYHNLDHLCHVISELQRIDIAQNDRKILSLALFYHDIIYKSNDANDSDETLSARYAGEKLKNIVIESDLKRIKALIEATNYQSEVTAIDSLKNTMNSIDLSILGQSDEIYLNYVNNIKIEYSDVPDEIFIAKRKKILIKLLDKAKNNKLYLNAVYSDKYNDKAIKNLTKELGRN